MLGLVVTGISLILIAILLSIPPKCKKCGTRMEEEYYVPGIQDSMYHKCPNCGNKI